MSPLPRIVLLSGGGGGARLARGFYGNRQHADCLVVTNPGDDFEHLGLTICPDTDSVLYAMSGRLDGTRGWGRDGESWTVLSELGSLGGPEWFQLGDKDIALHMLRQHYLARGLGLAEVTEALSTALGIEGITVTPATEDVLRTRVETEGGVLGFQEYFVGEQCQPRATGFSYEGCDSARLSPALEQFLERGCDAVVLGPSNPYLSLNPMLAISGMVKRLGSAGRVIAVSPVVGNGVIKGPLAKIMGEQGLEPTALAWAELLEQMYPKFIDSYVFDDVDHAAASAWAARGHRAACCSTVMNSDADKVALAQWLVAEVSGHD